MRDAAFFQWLEGHQSSRSELSLDQLISESGGPSGLALVAVDLIKGFCSEGPLASAPVGELVEPTVRLVERCHQMGVEGFYFPCDAHPPDSAEFRSFPPHCLVGTSESELATPLSKLPFAAGFRRYDKGSVSSLVGTGLAEDLKERSYRTILCCGDCTDLCLYHLAVGLRFFANQHGQAWRVVVPADLVATYDLGVEQALAVGAMPHPGPLLHDLFLYHLELNGVEVVGSIS